jgi:Domain of unknown function (DUF4132)
MSFISPNPQILLEPAEWAWATWRPRQPLSRHEPAPFDRADALQRLKKIRRLKSGRWDWTQVKVPMMRSAEEAIFWYQALTTALKFGHVKDFLLACQELAVNIAPSPEDFTIWLEQTNDKRQIDSQILKPLSYFFAPSQLLDWAVENDRWGHLRSWFVQGLQFFVLPYLTDGEMALMRTTIRETWQHWNLDRHLDLLILFGLHPEMDQLARNLLQPGNQQYGWPYKAIFGLGDREEVINYGKILKIRFTTGNQVRAWLAHTELSGLDTIFRSIAELDSNKARAMAQDLFFAFSLTVNAEDIAPHMFSLMKKSRVVGLAEDWLTENISMAINGLLPAATNNPQILTWLKVMARQGHRPQIETAIHRLTEIDPPSNYQILADQILDPIVDSTIPAQMPPALTNIIEQVSDQTATFDWIKAADLPRIVVNGQPLSLEQQQSILDLICVKDADLSALIDQADGQSLSDFIYDFLVCAELKQHHYGCWQILKKLGSRADDRLIPIIVRLLSTNASWSREIIQSGLAVLGIIGGNLAVLELMKLLYLEGHIPNVAETLTSMVPPREIDNSATLNSSFAYTGENRWRMEQQALDHFSSIATNKRELTSLLKLQNSRLERQMLDGTPISSESFQACLASAVFAPIFQQLVWAGYQQDGKKINLRVTEDFTLADMHDNLLSDQPEKFVFFCLPHPVNLPKPELLAWSNLFSDYKIIQPFEQLNRRTYLAESGGSIYTDLRDRSVFSLKLTSSLKKAGWQSHSERRGNWQDFTKTDGDSNITAVVRTARTQQKYTDRYVDRIFFIDTAPNQLDVSHSQGALDFTAVPMVFFSEVLRAIDLILKPKNSG